MDQQQEQQQPGGNTNAENAGLETKINAADTGQADPAQADAAKAEQAKQEAAKQQAAVEAAEAAKNQDPNKGAGEHVGVLRRFAHGVEHASGVEAWERHERRRQAFESAKAGPVGAAVNDVNAFIQAMHDCDADTPEQMLADTDVQNAAKRAREGLKVFTGETPVVFSKPTSDAHLNVGSGGAVTGNTKANQDRAAAIQDEHDDGEEAAPGVAKVPQPDALVR